LSNNVVNPYRFVSAPWDFEDNMVYANQAAFDAAWVPSNTKVDGNPTTDKLDIEDDIDYQDDVVYYDLTSTSNTDNIWRFIVDLTTFTQNTVSANEHAVYILLSDNTGISTASNDCYGFKIMAQISGGSVYRTITSNGVAPSSSPQTNFATVPSVSIFGLECKRTSSTSATIGIYNSDFSTLTEEEIITVASTTQTLRYLKIIAKTQDTNGNITLTLDDFQIMKTQDTPP
jgi:hypothetical protein